MKILQLGKFYPIEGGSGKGDVGFDNRSFGTGH